jgi:hypothetical protein
MQKKIGRQCNTIQYKENKIKEKKRKEKKKLK